MKVYNACNVVLCIIMQPRSTAFSDASVVNKISCEKLSICITVFVETIAFQSRLATYSQRVMINDYVESLAHLWLPVSNTNLSRIRSQGSIKREKRKLIFKSHSPKGALSFEMLDIFGTQICIS